MGRTGITDRDLHQMMTIVRHGAEDEVTPGMPWELLRDLKELVECDLLSASGLDSVTLTTFVDQEVGALAELTPAMRVDLEAAFLRHYWDSTCSYPDRTGDLESVIRESDLVPDHERGRMPMYVEYDRPCGVEHELMVCLPAGRPGRTLRLLFARGPGSDFTDRDIAVLTLLRPHLQAAYVAAERRRRGLLPLTARQRQVLQYVAAGFTNGQIARRLQISEATVGKHLENIFARLEVTSRAAAVAMLSPPL
jgi:DNA-binding CsgD family transcriptional regulator